jgi:hypothetical protein
MPTTQMNYAIGVFNDEISSTSTSVSATVDLANYFNVGKRELKFIVATNWGSTVAATAETCTVYFEESDVATTAGSTVTATALSGVTLTTSAGGEGVTEFNALVSKRYVRAKAFTSAAATAFFGVAAIVLPIRRFGQ